MVDEILDSSVTPITYLVTPPKTCEAWFWIWMDFRVGRRTGRRKKVEGVDGVKEMIRK